MKITLAKLRRLIREAKISASPEYMKKEAVREHIQGEILDGVRSGEIGDQQSLDEFFKTREMALNALKMVKFDIFKKIAAKR